MSEMWWYLSRSSGIVATVLIVLALAWGFLFSARATGSLRPARWWLDLHRYLGGLAFVFTGVHLIAVWQDEKSGIGLTEILVPMTAEGWAWGITWGVIACYAFAAVVFSTWPTRRLSRRRWRLVHLTSVPATVMVAAHAWMVGSSAGSLLFRAVLVALTGLAVYPLVLRLVGAAAMRRRLRTPRAPTRSTARPRPIASQLASVPSRPAADASGSGGHDRDRAISP